MLRRIVPAVAVSALVLAGVTGCTPAQTSLESCQKTLGSAALQPGILSDSVRVKTGFGELPEVAIPQKLVITQAQKSVIETGDVTAPAATNNTIVAIDFAMYDAKTNEVLGASPAFSGQSQSPQLVLITDSHSDPLVESLRCAVPGERYVVAVPSQDPAQAGQTTVGVVDVHSVSPTASQGAVRSLPAGFPAVVTNDEGRPGIVLPPTTPAQGNTKSAARIIGDGDTVRADDGVVAHVLQVAWDGTETQNTWNTGIINLGTEDQMPQTGYSFRDLLTGHTVGSQMVIITNTDGVASAYVIDILAAMH